MKKTTTVTAPDGSVTKIRSKSSCGCLTFLVLAFAAGLLIEAWQGSSDLERAFYVLIPVMLGSIALFVYGRRHSTPDARLSRHLEHCEQCEKDLPCEEWDRLYAASETS